MKKKVVNKKKSANKVEEDLVKAEPCVAKEYISTSELRSIYMYTWQLMFDKLIDFGPKANLTPEEFMRECANASDMYVRYMHEVHNGRR